jgi:hypothetical protein
MGDCSLKTQRAAGYTLGKLETEMFAMHLVLSSEGLNPSTTSASTPNSSEDSIEDKQTGQTRQTQLRRVNE